MKERVYVGDLEGRKVYKPGPGIIRLDRGEQPIDNEPVFFYGEVIQTQHGYRLKTKRGDLHLGNNERVFLDLHDDVGVVLETD